MRLRQTLDLDTVIKLDRKIFPGDFPLSIREAGAYWLASIDDKPVGFCAIHPIDREPDACFLSRAGVMQKYQGAGLQKKMLTVRENWAKRHGYTRLVTYSAPWNFKSIASLVKKNYKLYHPEQYWGENDSLYFYKNLRSK